MHLVVICSSNHYYFSNFIQEPQPSAGPKGYTYSVPVQQQQPQHYQQQVFYYSVNFDEVIKFEF